MEMNRKSNRWPLVIYDLVIMLALDLLMVLFYVTTQALSWQSVVLHGIVSALCVFTARYLGKMWCCARWSATRRVLPARCVWWTSDPMTAAT